MELDPDEVFRDDDDDPDSDSFRDRNATKELAVYLVDASPKMFSTKCPSDDDKEESHFHIAMVCIVESFKSQIINRSYDEVAVCFFNTRERKNLQDLSSVYVFDVADKESLDRPTAKLIKELSSLEDVFMKQIGSQYGIVAETRENSLYNALWAAQALLRKGSAKTADKRILIFTNEDDPFRNMKGGTKADMTRTTIQRAKDAQDMGIAIDLLPLSPPERKFGLSNLYADVLGLEGDDLAQFMPAAGESFAVAFYSNPLHSRLVALIAQDEEADASGQHEPPGMHMIFLPYSDDIRQIEEIHSHPSTTAPRASNDQIDKAAALVKRIDLLDFSVGQFTNPALQGHYAILQALALQEDELPEMKDETLPDEEGLARLGVVKAINEFKLSVYGDNRMENVSGQEKVTEASKKRKALMDNAVRDSAKYNWADLAKCGKIKDLTVVDLKRYLTAHNLPVSGKKDDLIMRILSHIGISTQVLLWLCSVMS